MLRGRYKKGGLPCDSGERPLQEVAHYCSKGSGGTLPVFPCLTPATLLEGMYPQFLR